MLIPKTSEQAFCLAFRIDCIFIAGWCRRSLRAAGSEHVQGTLNYIYITRSLRSQLRRAPWRCRALCVSQPRTAIRVLRGLEPEVEKAATEGTEKPPAGQALIQYVWRVLICRWALPRRSCQGSLPMERRVYINLWVSGPSQEKACAVLIEKPAAVKALTHTCAMHVQ